MEKKSKISFVENTTTRQAFAYSVMYGWVFWRNVCRNVNRTVHSLPWLFIGVTALGFTLACFVMVGQARADRDYYNRKATKAEQQLSSYKAMLDGKEARP